MHNFPYAYKLQYITFDKYSKKSTYDRSDDLVSFTLVLL